MELEKFVPGHTPMRCLPGDQITIGGLFGQHLPPTGSEMVRCSSYEPFFVIYRLRTSRKELLTNRYTVRVGAMYTALISSRRQIRLVTLLSGSPSTKICCKLSTVSLDDRPYYQALSYVWSKVDNKKSIDLNGSGFSVTNNLHAALLRLRWPDRNRNLWIDAICINQNDEGERSQQIPLMGAIYSCSEEVIVWLGEASDDSDAAADLINRLSKSVGDGFVWESEERGSVGVSTDYIREVHATGDNTEFVLGELVNSLIDGETTKAFVALLNRPWWHRTWVVQEITLAKRAQVYCGNISFPWDDLERAIMRVALYGKRNDQALKQLRDHINTPSILGLMKFPFVQNQTPQNAPLLSLLNQHTARGVTDKQDKIYAMLSLTTDPQHTLPTPNYCRNYHQVYRETAFNFIRHMHNLDVLNQVWDPEQKSTLPSWVPDWDKAYEPHPLLETSEKKRPFQSALNTRPKISDSEDPDILTLTGLLIDDIVEVSVPSTFPTDFDRFYQEWETFGGMEDPLRPYIGGGDICNAFWRTLTANKFLGSTANNSSSRIALQAPESDRMAFLVFSKRADVPKEFMKNHPSEEERYSKYVRNFSNRLIYSVKNRRLIRTAKGYLGTGPTHVKRGDQICILLGGATPLIVRPNDKRYKLIGDSYVHGLMNGEAMQGLRRGEIRFLEFSFQ